MNNIIQHTSIDNLTDEMKNKISIYESEGWKRIDINGEYWWEAPDKSGSVNLNWIIGS